MFKLKNLPFTISLVVVISLIVGWGINLVLAWTDPSANPPSGNVSAPINVSGTAQTKTGNFTVPIVYDYNNTGYYVDPNANSWLYRIYSYDIRADIYYDRNDTGYYVDPASTTNLSTLCIRGDCRTSWPSGADGNNYTTAISFSGTTTKTLTLSRSGMGNLTASFTDDTGITAESDTLDSVVNRGDWTNDSVRIPIMYDYNNTGYYVDPNANSWLYRIYSYDIRADIMYDRNNTGYYVDPDSTTNLSTLCIGGDCKTAWPSTAESDTLQTVTNRGDTTDKNITVNGMWSQDFLWVKNYINTPGIVYSGNGKASMDANGNITAEGIWAYIMYDRNNTGYYLNPDSTSKLWRLDVNDLRADIMYDLADTYYYVNPNSGSRVYELDATNRICIQGDCRTSWPSATENDTLQTVTDRGNRTWNDIYAPAFYDQNDGYYRADPNDWSIFYGAYVRDLRADIMYDWNHGTGWYVDPGGSSNINNLSANSVYSDGWVTSGTGVRAGAAQMEEWSGNIVGNTIYANDDLVANNNSYGACDWTIWNSGYPDYAGCPSDRFVTRVQHSGNQIRVYCCEL